MLNRAFIYIVFNTLIVPGLAIPSSMTAYQIIQNNVLLSKLLLQNFFMVKSGDFFVTLLMQQISFGFLASMNQFGQLFNWYFSANLFLASKRVDPSESVYLKKEDETFEYGYNLAQIMTISCIMFVYS